MLKASFHKDLNLSPQHSLFYYIKNQTVKMDMTFQDVHEKYKAEDGFVYVTIKAYETGG